MGLPHRSSARQDLRHINSHQCEKSRCLGPITGVHPTSCTASQSQALRITTGGWWKIPFRNIGTWPTCARSFPLASRSCTDEDVQVPVRRRRPITDISRDQTLSCSSSNWSIIMSTRPAPSGPTRERAKSLSTSRRPEQPWHQNHGSMTSRPVEHEQVKSVLWATCSLTHGPHSNCYCDSAGASPPLETSATFRLSPARVAVSGSASRRAPENLPAVLLCGHETDPVRSIAQALATVSTGLWSRC